MIPHQALHQLSARRDRLHEGRGRHLPRRRRRLRDHQPCGLGDGLACRSGACLNLCDDAPRERSNVGCEYWAVDLDNAVIGATATPPRSSSRSSSRTRARPRRPTSRSSRTTAQPGDAPAPREVARRAIAPLQPRGLQARPARGRRLEPRRRRSTPAPHTALTRARLPGHVDVPIVAYQFNPLENVERLLERRVAAQAASSARRSTRRAAAGVRRRRLAADHRAHRRSRHQLRRDRRSARVPDHRRHRRRTPRSSVKTRPRGSSAAARRRRPPAGGVIDVTLERVRRAQPRDRRLQRRLHRHRSSTPIGRSRCSSAARPATRRSSRRSPTARCCADHLEEQLDRHAHGGHSFVAAHTARAAPAPWSAPAPRSVVDEPDYFRVVAAVRGGRTSRPRCPRPTTRSLSTSAATTGRSRVAPRLPGRRIQAVIVRQAGEPGSGRRQARPPRRRSAASRRAAHRAVPQRLRLPHARQVLVRLRHVIGKPSRQVALDGELSTTSAAS